MLAVKLETTHKLTKAPTKQPNHPQISQTTHKPVKPPTNQPKASQTTHKPAKYRTNQLKTNQLLAESQFLMLPKTLATMQNMC